MRDLYGGALVTTPEYLTREYYRDRRPAERSWPEQDPPPEVTTRDPRPEGAPGIPSAVIKLQRAAQGAGWAVSAGYSRGPERAVRIGEYKITECWGLYSDRHPETGWRFQALYSRTVDTKPWAWRIGIRRPGHLIGPDMGVVFLHATITDLHEFVLVRGSVGVPWFKGVQARVEAQKEAQKKATKARPKTRKEGGR